MRGSFQNDQRHTFDQPGVLEGKAFEHQSLHGLAIAQSLAQR